MSFFIKDDEMWKKYEQIWYVIKNKLGIKFHGEPIYEKYLKPKVREYGEKTFWVMIRQKKICIMLALLA